jgi:hypothetical protein
MCQGDGSAHEPLDMGMWGAILTEACRRIGAVTEVTVPVIRAAMLQTSAALTNSVS